MLSTVLQCLLLVTGVSQAVAQDISVAGVVTWMDRTVMTLGQSGTVMPVQVKTGDRVSAGDTLVRLDARRFDAAVSASAQKLTAMQLAREDSDQELERAEILYEEGSMSAVELQRVVLANAKVRASHEGASAEHAEAISRRRMSMVEAPFDALVVETYVMGGQHIVAGSTAVPVVVVARADMFAVEANVDSDTADQLSPGRAVTVVVLEKEYPGVIDTIGLEPVSSDSNGGTRYRVLVQVPTDDQRPRIGNAASITW